MKFLLILALICVIGVEPRMFLKEWFNKADLDLDSVLSFDEAKKTLLPKLTGFIQQLPDTEGLSVLWKEMDNNQNNQLEFDEFKTAAVKFFNQYAEKKELSALMKQFRSVSL